MFQAVLGEASGNRGYNVKEIQILKSPISQH